MNLIAGTVVEQNGSLSVDCGPAGRSEILSAPLAAGVRKAGAKEFCSASVPKIRVCRRRRGGVGDAGRVRRADRAGAILHLTAGDRAAKIVAEKSGPR